MYRCILFICLILPSVCLAQEKGGVPKLSPAYADSCLASLFTSMDDIYDYCYKDTADAKIDSLSNAPIRIEEYIEDIIEKAAFSLTAPFPVSKEAGLHYTSSGDQQLRVYSYLARTRDWDVPWHNYFHIAAYTTAKGRRSGMITIPNLRMGYCNGLTKLHLKDGKKPVYIASYCDIQGEKTEMIVAYRVVNDTLKQVPFFEQNGIMADKIDCQYTPSEKEDADSVNAIHFSEDKTKLYIPVPEEKGNMTPLSGRFMIYVFNGNKFVLNKETK